MAWIKVDAPKITKDSGEARPLHYPVDIIKHHDIVFSGSPNAAQIMATDTAALFDYNHSMEQAFVNNKAHGRK